MMAQDDVAKIAGDVSFSIISCTRARAELERSLYDRHVELMPISSARTRMKNERSRVRPASKILSGGCLPPAASVVENATDDLLR